MDLAKRDIDIQYLHNLIKDNDKFLFEKHKSLSKLQKDNPFLKDVVDEYNEYFSGISQQNQAQYNALQTLADYITQLLLEPGVTEEIVRQCKYDMGLIRAELNLLRKNGM
jgi:hypothetical protein